MVALDAPVKEFYELLYPSLPESCLKLPAILEKHISQILDHSIFPGLAQLAPMKNQTNNVISTTKHLNIIPPV